MAQFAVISHGPMATDGNNNEPPSVQFRWVSLERRWQTATDKHSCSVTGGDGRLHKTGGDGRLRVAPRLFATP
eukprot:6389745-Pyramimonas_sp.AAC.1